jgi:hypothetical protein
MATGMATEDPFNLIAVRIAVGHFIPFVVSVPMIFPRAADIHGVHISQEPPMARRVD